MKFLKSFLCCFTKLPGWLNRSLSLFSKRLPCTILSRHPVIIASYWEDFLKERDPILATLPELESSFGFFQLGWEYESADRAEHLAEDAKRLKRLKPNFNPIFLANSLKEQLLIERLGQKAIFAQQNAFLNEGRYSIINNKEFFDAIYIARITPFKRHELARKISSLLLIGNYSKEEEEYALQTLASLQQATWIRKIYSWKIKEKIAQARVGLCLSKAEGAMFCSAEYLLCGKPVVSTASIGGRDALFDSSHCFIVADDPDDLSAGVKRAIALKSDPQKIRQKTLLLMKEHRARLIAEIQQIFDRAGVGRSAQLEWPQIFLHKLGLRCGIGPLVRLNRALYLKSRLPN